MECGGSTPLFINLPDHRDRKTVSSHRTPDFMSDSLMRRRRFTARRPALHFRRASGKADMQTNAPAVNYYRLIFYSRESSSSASGNDVTTRSDSDWSMESVPGAVATR